jgi:hypothetical protein
MIPLFAFPPLLVALILGRRPGMRDPQGEGQYWEFSTCFVRSKREVACDG